jgi:UDP-N-acetylglucosamine 4,6-dehydratase (inverting)
MSISKKTSILITGGTGSFGKAFIKRILENYPNIKRLVIFSRDELKQWELKQQYPEDQFPSLRFILGDIRDKDRLKSALEGIDVVVHAAALKQVPTAEYNPIEFINTNVIGSENLVKACLETKVSQVIALSTDKAASPVNLYGATKLCADKLFIAANNIKGHRELKFSVVRYGNVMGSRGSVIPFFLKEAKKGKLPITSFEMTRFNISLDEGVDMVLWALDNSYGGEIFVKKLPSYNLKDLAKAIGPKCIHEVIGIRHGEKLHEEMITSSDSYLTLDIGLYYVILPNNKKVKDYYQKKYGPNCAVKEGFSYSSGSNEDFLSVESLRELIKKCIDVNFVPK